jgi:hypothetical protein
MHIPFLCCVLSFNEYTRVWLWLTNGVFYNDGSIRKFLDSCFGFMWKGIASGKGYLYSKALSPLPNEKENLIFSNDKLFHICFPLDVLTFRALKLFHAQVFNVNTKTFTNQECWLTKELLPLHECTKFWATYNH